MSYGFFVFLNVKLILAKQAKDIQGAQVRQTGREDKQTKSL